MARRTNKSQVLDPNRPINWEYPLNNGLVSEWAAAALPYGFGTPLLYDLVRGAKSPSDGTLQTTGGYVTKWALSQVGGCIQYVPPSFGAVTIPITPPSGLMAWGCWFNTTYNNIFIMGWNDSFPPGGVFDRSIYLDSSGKLNCYIFDGTTHTITSTLTYNDGTWHSVVAVIDGSLRLYADGEQVASVSSVTHAYNGYSTPKLILGLGGGANAYAGLQTRHLVFSRGPLASEIADLHDQSLRGNPDRWNWLRTRTWFVPTTILIPVSWW